MSIDNPTQLVNEFKKSGQFDRLRQELLAQVAQGSGMTTLKTRVEEVAQHRFSSDPKLSFMPLEAIHRELMQEMERFPVVERVAGDVQLLSEPSFIENVCNSVKTILLESKGQKVSLQKDEKNETTGTPIPSEIHLSTSLNPSLSVVVTPAPPIPTNNSTLPPPNSTLGGSAAVQPLEQGLETVSGTIPMGGGVSEPSNLTTSGADVEMADGTQEGGEVVS